jgi:septation ring formation regulator EzrA
MFITLIRGRLMTTPYVMTTEIIINIEIDQNQKETAKGDDNVESVCNHVEEERQARHNVQEYAIDEEV